VAAHTGKLLSMWYWAMILWAMILVPGLISLFRGIWLFFGAPAPQRNCWSGRKPFRVYFPLWGPYPK